MEIDDPSVPEFASWRSYHNFSERVRAGKRLIWPKEVRAFLDTVLATNKERDVNIRQGTVLFRAQQGIEYQVIKDEGGRYISEEPMGYSRLRMKPGETVEVALPRLEGSAGPFAARAYAIRIRVRQLR